jgi:hypothetical protein
MQYDGVCRNQPVMIALDFMIVESLALAPNTVHSDSFKSEFGLRPTLLFIIRYALDIHDLQKNKKQLQLVASLKKSSHPPKLTFYTACT